MIILLVSVLWFHTAEAIVWGGVVSTCISLVVNAWPNRKLLHYGFMQQARDLAPSLIISLIMFLVVSAAGKLPLPAMILLPIQVVIGVAVYGGLSLIIRSEALMYMLETAKSVLSRNR